MKESGMLSLAISSFLLSFRLFFVSCLGRGVFVLHFLNTTASGTQMWQTRHRTKRLHGRAWYLHDADNIQRCIKIEFRHNYRYYPSLHYTHTHAHGAQKVKVIWISWNPFSVHTYFFHVICSRMTSSQKPFQLITEPLLDRMEAIFFYTIPRWSEL